MLVALLLVLAGGFLLYAGGESLVAGSARLALRLGLTPLVVGLTVVAFGTSSPELAVTLGAALGGIDDVAVGNVVGSNICNIALILGLAALVRPVTVQAQLVKVDAPVMLACSLLVAGLLWDARIARAEAALLGAGIAVYVVANLRMARREPPVVREELEGAAPQERRSWLRVGALVVGGLAALVAGADLFVRGALAFAEAAGLSRSLVALTVVSVGTSLPELATSLLAAARGQGDIAVGNVVGSNIFNLLAILGITGLVRPLGMGGVLGADVAVMVVVAALSLPLLYTGLRVTRTEGAFLLAVYVAYVGWRAGV